MRRFRTDRDVEMRIRQAEDEERKRREGRERICVDIQRAVLWFTTTPQANTRAVSYTVTKTRSGLVQSRSITLLLPVKVRLDFSLQWPVFRWRSGADLFCKRTHQFNRLSSSLSSYHPQFALSISRTYKPLTAWGCLSWVQCRGDAVY